MLYGINEVSVIVAAILAMAIGSVWYSPLGFGKPWMAALGITEEDMEASKSQMPKLFALAFLANLVVFYTLAYFVLLAERAGDTILNFSVWLTVLLTFVLAGFAVWEQKSLSYLLINIGFTAIMVVGGMHVIAFWPW